jgi:hypothetical protein
MTAAWLPCACPECRNLVQDTTEMVPIFCASCDRTAPDADVEPCPKCSKPAPLGILGEPWDAA